VDLDEAAGELYGLPPEEFTAARKEREAAARADGDRELARAIAGLGKPSTAAWVCNLLVRARPGEVEGLLELGDLLREAQEGLAGDQLRQLDVQRRQLIVALARQARALAFAQGHRVTEAVAGQVEDTLRAAMSDPDAGEALRSGRLTSALSYSGLGTGRRADLRVVPPPRTTPPRTTPPRTTPPPRAAAAKRDEERRAAEERRRREREEARRALEEAEAAAEEAEDAAERERDRAGELATAQEQRQQQADELAGQLERLCAELAAAEPELDRARRRARSAERRAGEAAGAREKARARLAELEREG
jgi:hypothetical protein